MEGGKGREGSKYGRESAVGKGNKGSECCEFGWESAEGGEGIKIEHGGEGEGNAFGPKSADGEGIKHGRQSAVGEERESAVGEREGNMFGRESAVGEEGKDDRESGDCASREERDERGRESGGEETEEKKTKPNLMEGGGRGLRCDASPRTGARTTAKKLSEASSKQGGAPRAASPSSLLGRPGGRGGTQGARGGEATAGHQLLISAAAAPPFGPTSWA
jgi:hypothetical protein